MVNKDLRVRTYSSMAQDKRCLLTAVNGLQSNFEISDAQLHDLIQKYRAILGA